MNTFVRHTFPMSKSSIKTKTVLTMTNMTESTKLLAFKRQRDSYKVTVNIYLCICVVPSWNELKVRQNLLASAYDIHVVCILVATVYCHNFCLGLLSYSILHYILHFSVHKTFFTFMNARILSLKTKQFIWFNVVHISHSLNIPATPQRL